MIVGSFRSINLNPDEPELKIFIRYKMAKISQYYFCRKMRKNNSKAPKEQKL